MRIYNRAGQSYTELLIYIIVKSSRALHLLRKVFGMVQSR